jgi:hypothetical protein
VIADGPFPVAWTFITAIRVVIFQDVLPQLGQRHARFDTNTPCRRIPVEHTVHAPQVDDDVLTIHGGITVAVAAAAQADTPSAAPGQQQHLVQRLGRHRAIDVAQAARYAAPRTDLFQVVGGQQVAASLWPRGAGRWVWS